MDRFRPKYVTFDCHGTLINFQMAEAARDLFGRLLDGPRMDEFIRNFSAYRLDEVMQDWKPYADVVHNRWSAPAAATTSHSVPKTLKRSTTASRPGDRIRTYRRDWPNWPRKFRWLPFTNAMTAQIPSNVAKLGAPFHAVYTAEEARAYKPHFKAFEYMFDMLGCGPEDITHVSSSFRYDLMSAYDLGIKSKVWVNRRHEPANPYYEYTEIPDVTQLPGVFGI